MYVPCYDNKNIKDEQYYTWNICTHTFVFLQQNLARIYIAECAIYVMSYRIYLRFNDCEEALIVRDGRTLYGVLNAQLAVATMCVNFWL